MRALVALGVSAILAASCAPPNETGVTMSEYRFDPVDMSVPAGDVRFLLVNSGNEPHDLSIAERFTMVFREAIACIGTR